MQVKGLADWVVGLLVELAANGTLPDGDGDGIPDCADADIDGNGMDDHLEPEKDLTGLADTDEDGSSGQTSESPQFDKRAVRSISLRRCAALGRAPTHVRHARTHARPNRCA